jgi:uncharacterized protein YjiK
MRARDRTGTTWLGLLLGLMLLTGCATRGPNHVYLTTAASPEVHDLGPASANIADAVKPGEQALGLAYDFNTDHLFVRIAPAQVIRVIERPSGKILREMPLPEESHIHSPADLAIRSSDRHLFVLNLDRHSATELTLFGAFVRRIDLSAFGGAISGLAYDQKNDRLLVLPIRSPARVGSVDADGNVTYYVTLAAAVSAITLGYDSDAQHYFVPLADGVSLGEFDAAGNLVTTHPAAGAGPITAIDAGPRSLVRVF